MVQKADQAVVIADVQRQVAAVRSGETVPLNSPVGESQRKSRVENAVQRVRLIRTRKDALEKRLNTRVRSSDPTRHYGRVVRGIDHNKREKDNRAEPRTEMLVNMTRKPHSRVWREDVHDVTEHEQEWSESRYEVLRRNMAGAESEE